MIKYFKVQKTGKSFWDSIMSKNIYEFRYKHDNNKTFLATSKYSLFRIDNTKQ